MSRRWRRLVEDSGPASLANNNLHVLRLSLGPLHSSWQCRWSHLAWFWLLPFSVEHFPWVWGAWPTNRKMKARNIVIGHSVHSWLTLSKQTSWKYEKQVQVSAASRSPTLLARLIKSVYCLAPGLKFASSMCWSHFSAESWFPCFEFEAAVIISVAKTSIQWVSRDLRCHLFFLVCPPQNYLGIVMWIALSCKSIWMCLKLVAKESQRANRIATKYYTKIICKIRCPYHSKAAAPNTISLGFKPSLPIIPKYFSALCKSPTRAKADSNAP